MFGIPTLRYLVYCPQEGDLVFQSLPHGELVDAIEGVTESEYSHCGVVVRGRIGWLVTESLGDVHDTPLWQWVSRGRGTGRFAVYRLRPEHRKHIPEFLNQLRHLHGSPYDIEYSEDDHKLYCSELVWKAYKRATGDALGQWVPLRELNWQGYAGTISTLGQGCLPLDRLLITPKNVSAAEQLIRVE